VHDVGSYRVANQWRELQAGMLLTVEPGIYISPSAKNVDAKWLGIGVRIEDDVLVTERGYEVITDDLVKSVNDIESLMAR